MTPGETPLEPTVARVQVRNYEPGDERELVALLNGVSLTSEWSEERWRAKHSGRPGFDAKDVCVAVHGDRIVACLHTAVIPIGLGPGITVSAALDGDLAIVPEFRGAGIAARLYAETSQSLRERNITLRLGYSESAARVHYYTRTLGYTTGFDTTRAYKKLLDENRMAHRILQRMGSSPEARDPGRGPVVEIHLTGLEPVRLRLAGGTITLAKAYGADLRIAAGQDILDGLSEGTVGLRRIISLWRTGRLRMGGCWTGGLRVLWWLLRWRTTRRGRSGGHPPSQLGRI